MDNFILWGSSGHAKVLANLIAQKHGKIVALFDNDPASISVVDGVPLYIGEAGFKQWLGETTNPANVSGLVAIGGSRGKDRLEIQELFRKHGIRLAPVVHAQAFVCPSATLGEGTQVLAHALVASDAVVGKACILNHKSSVDHECVIGDGVHLAPGAILCGCVEVGDYAMIGAGAVVLPRVKIGKGAIIGAGAVVTQDIPDGVVAHGSPAKVVRPV